MADEPASPNSVTVATEREVLDAFERHLRANGWETDREVQFVDMVAKRDGATRYVEAKGRTTSPGLDVDTLYGQLLRRMTAPSPAVAYWVVVPTSARSAALRVSPEIRQVLRIEVFEVTPSGDVVGPLGELPPAPTSRAELERMGFAGFVRFEDLPSAGVPRAAGVYAVLREATTAPEFLERSPGGHFKGKDPSVGKDVLRDAWVEGVDVLYIGKAGAGKSGRRGLAKRLDEYRRFGAGQAVGHQGGRYIWQLADSEDLLVAWLPTPEDDPGDVEARLVEQFVRATGRRPFANRNLGSRRPDRWTLPKPLKR